MDLRVVGIINNQVRLDEENFVWEKKIRLEPLGIARNINIPEEYKKYIEVIYNEKQTQIIAIDVLIPQGMEVVEFLRMIKDWINDVVEINVGMILWSIGYLYMV